ncbi:MAG: EAL domain-containing protein [Gordonia sp. (in: high G+C Gram-positive bacteria)]
MTSTGGAAHPDCARTGARGGRLHIVVLTIACDPFHRAALRYGLSAVLRAAQQSMQTIAHRLGNDAVVTRVAESRWRVAVRLRGASRAQLYGNLEKVLSLVVRDSDPTDRYLDCHVGVAVEPELPGVARTDLADYADAALSLGLRARHRIRFAGRADVAAIRDSVDLATRLRQAALDDFPLVYQPIVRLSDRAVLGFESLLRWREGPTLHTPGNFLAEAEMSWRVVEMGRQTVPVAVGALATELASLCTGDAPFVTINLSAQQLLDPRLTSIIATALDRHDIAPHQLWIEVREDTAIARDSRASTTIGQLHKLGCRIGIDDLGAGYSALTYIRDLPIDILKLDRSLVTRVADDPLSAVVMTAICQMAAAAGITTVAEGIESEDLIPPLEEYGIDYAQGFLFGRPAFPAELVG